MGIYPLILKLKSKLGELNHLSTQRKKINKNYRSSGERNGKNKKHICFSFYNK